MTGCSQKNAADRELSIDFLDAEGLRRIFAFRDLGFCCPANPRRRHEPAKSIDNSQFAAIKGEMLGKRCPKDGKTACGMHAGEIWRCPARREGARRELRGCATSTRPCADGASAPAKRLRSRGELAGRATRRVLARAATTRGQAARSGGCGRDDENRAQA